ncbi:MAG: aldehyde dehydrogenase family protein [Solirubrobacterales bacterium]|nr:aldehyde dehydrogenase family protein [Solirubrobacterales bacterium]
MFDVAGQKCCASSRTIVHEDIADAFIEAVVEATRERQLGDPLDDSTQQGPQIDAAHVKHIHSLVAQAKEQGASILAGGETPPDLGGNFYAPTIIDGARHDMRISQEEIFGPVGCMYRASDLDSAIDQANATPFGLSSAVWASDPYVLDRFVRESRVGVCWVNTFELFDPEVPWGGTKRSGYGRELGHEALGEFTTAKTVYWER